MLRKLIDNYIKESTLNFSLFGEYSCETEAITPSKLSIVSSYT